MSDNPYSPSELEADRRRANMRVAALGVKVTFYTIVDPEGGSLGLTWDIQPAAPGETEHIEYKDVTPEQLEAIQAADARDARAETAEVRRATMRARASNSTWERGSIP